MNSHLISNHCLQEKHDGRRLLVRKVGGVVIGINRRGLIVAIPDAIRREVEALPADALIDGEAVGEVLHGFDLLEVSGHDLRERRYLDRLAGLIALIPIDGTALRTTRTAFTPRDKEEMLEAIRHAQREGVVFKDLHAPYVAGRPASGGPQLKHKLVQSASFIVIGRHRLKRSVKLGLFDEGDEGGGDELLASGSVTIPPNHPVPEIGEVIEARYLYAFPGSGSVYQPVYLGPRADIPPADCTRRQLKFKPDAEDAAA